MILKKLKETFNPYTPISLKKFLLRHYWMWVIALVFGIPGVILEKSGAGIEVLLYIVMAVFGLSMYIEYIFTVKRYRAMNIPVVWATFVFIIPFNVIAFCVASSPDDFINSNKFKKLLNLIKEDNDV